MKVQVGGQVYYDVMEQIENNDVETNDVLLIAGGVGINPLYSMFLNNNEAFMNSSPSNAQKSVLGKTMLMYSAATKDELIFKVC